MVNCGAAMYIAPIGAVNAGDPKAAYDEAIAFASGHQQSFGLEAAGGLAAAVAAAFTPDITIEQVVDAVLSLAKDGTRAAIAAIADAAVGLRGRDHAAVVERFHAVIAGFSPIGDDFNRAAAHNAGVATEAYQPSRLHSIEELPLALGFALVNGGAFRKSIEDGINSGRDTDSIGVMAGAVLGAMHGEVVIDTADRMQLDSANRFDLTAAADRFAQVVAEIFAADSSREALKSETRDSLMSLPAELPKVVNQ
jgi:ADP-ribosylglycohydrolase